MKGSILALFALLCIFSIALAAQEDDYIGGGSDELLARFNYRTLFYDAAFFIPFIKPGMRIIDVGCGPGSITLGIANQVGPNGSVVGLDLDAPSIVSAIELAAQMNVTNVEFVEGNALSLPYANKSFDGVFVSAVFAHTNDIKDDIMLEIVRVLKDGGVFGLREPDHSRFWTWPDVPAARKIWDLISFRGSRSFDVGLEGKSIMLRNGFDIVGHTVFVELKDAMATLTDYIAAMTYDVILQDYITQQGLDDLHTQFAAEKVIHLAEPGNHAGFLWHGVVGQLTTNAVSPSVTLGSQSPKPSITSRPTASPAAPALRKQVRTL